MSKGITWISEEETITLLGLKDRKMLRRLITNGRLRIAWTRITNKSATKYNKEDVDNALIEHSTMVA
jgi:hypothetical protein